MIKKIVLLATITASLFAMGGPALVETGTLTKGEVNPLTEFIGNVKFNKQSTLASQSSGLAKSINFELGDRVNEGDVLVNIDSDILDAQIKSAKANLEMSESELKNAKRDFDRYAKLIRTKSVTQKVYDDAKLAYTLAKQKVVVSKSALQELSIQKDKKVIKAPYSGVVVEKSVDIGEWLNVGTGVATILNDKNIDVIFNLPTKFVNGLDKDFEYALNVGDRVYNSKIYAIIPKGDKLTRTFPVRFNFDIDDKTFVYEGMQSKAAFAKSSKTVAFLINRDAVIKRFGQNVVFIITNGVADMMPVQIVGYVGDNIAINAKGLKEGMSIVVKGNERVFPKQPVKVLNK